MELMDMKDYDIDFKEKRTNGYLIATLFIIVGILFLLRNLGMIDPPLFDLLVSWPMLPVVSGIFTIFHRNPVGGKLLVGVGVYFLFPQLNWITNDFLRVYWPLGLILLGLVIMLKRKDSIRTKKHKRPFNHPPFGHRKPNDEINYETDNGFVSVDTTFNSVRHIVLDPVFKGADIDVSFGNVILDLKKTTLEADETIINIDSSFSGVVIYVPKGWLVRLKVDSFLAGCQDMRDLTETTDMTHTLYICGDLSFSGLELRD